VWQGIPKRKIEENRFNPWTWPPPPTNFATGAVLTPRSASTTTREDRTGDDRISRRVPTNGVVSSAWQQVCLRAHHAGAWSRPPRAPGDPICSPGGGLPTHDEMFSAAHLSYQQSGMPGQAATFVASHR
jgi:hypothetical protein